MEFKVENIVTSAEYREILDNNYSFEEVLAGINEALNEKRNDWFKLLRKPESIHEVEGTIIVMCNDNTFWKFKDEVKLPISDDKSVRMLAIWERLPDIPQEDLK